MTNPANSDVQNLLPVQAYFSVTGEFQTFIGQGQPFYATISPDQSGLNITNSVINSTTIGLTTPAAGAFTSIATTTGTITTLPVSGNDMANKLYVDSVAAGLSWKQPVAVATLGNITLSGLQTIDTYTTLNGDRVMVKDQDDAAENGIYIANNSAWTRSEDANTWNELISAIAFIEYGTQKGSAWFSTAQPGGTLGVTDVVFAQFTTSATYNAGTGLTLTGFTFSITNVGTAGTYGSASQVPVFVTNAQGQVTSVTNTSIAIAASQITSGTLDSARLSGSYTGITGVGTLTAGTWQGNAVAVLYGGTGATTAGDARTNLGAAASGANSDISSMSGLTGAVGTPDSITFDIAPAVIPTAQGALYWDNTDSVQTLNLVMEGGNAIQQIGEEQYYRIKCSAAITEGQVVMFSGTVGASGGLTGAPATGLTPAQAPYVMGVATESGAINDWIYVTSFGLVRGINTTGGAESWVDGDILYLNPAVAGGLTKTLPTAPNPKVQVAAVVHASSNGSLFIRPSIGGILGQFEGDVGFTSTAAYDLIQRNAGNTAWVNVAASSIAAGSVANAVTFNSSGGAAAGTSFNGSVARTVDYSTVGAPSTSGSGASGTWGISITGNAGTATTSTNIAGGLAGGVPYQTGAGATTFLALGTTNYVLTAGASAPQYVDQSTLSVGSATNATNATNVGITDDTTTAATMYLTWVTSTTGNLPVKTSSTKLSFVPSTGVLTATGFSGPLSGNATSATNVAGGAANKIVYNTGSGATAFIDAPTTSSTSLTWNGSAFTWASAGGGVTLTDDTSTNATYYPTFATATSGTATGVKVASTKLTFNPSTGALTATSMVSSSDERLKTNWRSMPISFVEKLAGVKVGIYDRTDVEATQVGVSAQSLQAVLPDAVIKDAEGMLAISYGNAALAATVELAKMVLELRQEIDQLKGSK